jgi:shikimate dehydrogenase
MEIRGTTRLFAVLGHPVAHSLSPAMHNASIRALGLDAVYVAFDVAPDRLLEVLPVMGAMGFGGVNLTIPLKEVAFRGLRDLDATARDAGAVNTVKFHDGGMTGYNTDGEGWARAFAQAFGRGVQGLSICLLGAGGAARAVAMAAAADGAAALAIAARNAERAIALAADVRARHPALPVRVAVEADDQAAAARAADAVVNLTPLGLKPDDPPPLPASALRAGQLAMDTIYVAAVTPFLREAAAAGARTANGEGMLVGQGARAFEIWTGRAPDVAAMTRALAAARGGA